MSDTAEKINLLGLSPKKMEEFFADLGEKKFRAQQMLKWIHQYGEAAKGPQTQVVADVHQQCLVSEGVWDEKQTL